uniref:C-type lectin domain-containing protein n=1 Tax=Bursaphelenchus xylophilus TaxID=6326 RepID=A0A1I7RI79_BURXY
MLLTFLLFSLTLNVLAAPGSSTSAPGPAPPATSDPAPAPPSSVPVSPGNATIGPSPVTPGNVTIEPGPVSPGNVTKGPGSVSPGNVTTPPAPVTGTSQKVDPSAPTANPATPSRGPSSPVTQPVETTTQSFINHKVLKKYMFTATAFWPVSQLSKYCSKYNLSPAVIPDEQSNQIINTRLNLEGQDGRHFMDGVPLVPHAAIGLIFDKEKNKFTWLDGKSEVNYTNFLNPNEKDEAPKREKNSYYVQMLHCPPEERGKWLYVNETVYTTVLLCNHKSE